MGFKQIEATLRDTTLIFVVTGQHFGLLRKNLKRICQFNLLPSRILIIVTDGSVLERDTLETWCSSLKNKYVIRYLTRTERDSRASEEHLRALNIGLEETDSNFIWINDPDLYIASKEVLEIAISQVVETGILTTPWSPRWINKSRCVATPHFLYFDRRQFQDVFFTRDRVELDKGGKSLKSFQARRQLQTAWFKPESLIRRIMPSLNREKFSKFRFIVKYRLRIRFFQTTDTSFSKPLHAKGIGCVDLVNCSKSHLLQLVRKGIDVKKPDNFIFGLFWERFVLKEFSVWPAKRNFLTLRVGGKHIHDLLDHGEVLVIKNKIFAWHLRSIGQAGGNPKLVDYTEALRKAEVYIPTLDYISEIEISVNYNNGDAEVAQ